MGGASAGAGSFGGLVEMLLQRLMDIRPARMPYVGAGAVGAGAPLHEQYVQRLPLHELWWRRPHGRR